MPFHNFTDTLLSGTLTVANALGNIRTSAGNLFVNNSVVANELIASGSLVSSGSNYNVYIANGVLSSSNTIGVLANNLAVSGTLKGEHIVISGTLRQSSNSQIVGPLSISGTAVITGSIKYPNQQQTIGSVSVFKAMMSSSTGREMLLSVPQAGINLRIGEVVYFPFDLPTSAILLTGTVYFNASLSSTGSLSCSINQNNFDVEGNSTLTKTAVSSFNGLGSLTCSVNDAGGSFLGSVRHAELRLSGTGGDSVKILGMSYKYEILSASVGGVHG